jgi:uncharacterized protein
MAEHVVLFAGPMGAGKTTAVRSLSEIDVVSTEAANSERMIVDKETTTVALDYGEITLDAEDKVRLYGLPGQDRFDFMWSILKERAHGLVLLVSNDSPDPIAIALERLGSFEELLADGRVVIGITRSDLAADPSPAAYAAAIAAARPGLVLPIFTVDPRDARQMQTVLLSLVAIVETRTLISETATA